MDNSREIEILKLRITELVSENVQIKKALIALQSWIINQDKSIVSRLDAIDNKGGLKKTHIHKNRIKKAEKFWELCDPEGNIHITKKPTSFFKEHFGSKSYSAHNAINASGKYRGWLLLSSHMDKIKEESRDV